MHFTNNMSEKSHSLHSEPDSHVTQSLDMNQQSWSELTSRLKAILQVNHAHTLTCYTADCRHLKT